MRPTETEHDTTTEEAPSESLGIRLAITGPFGAEILADVEHDPQWGLIARDSDDGAILAWCGEDTAREDAPDVLASIFEGNGCGVTIETGGQ